MNPGPAIGSRFLKVPTSGGDLNVVDTGGQPPVVVLLHAFPFSSRMWAPQIEALRLKARLIAVDLKGFGRSDAPDDVTAYSMDAYADELRQVIVQLRLAPAILVGVAFGGWVALTLYRSHSNMVAGLVLADSRPDAESSEGRAKRLDQQLLARTSGVRAVTATWPHLLTAEASRQANPQLGDVVLESMEAGLAGFLGGLEAIRNRPDMSDVLGSLKVPTLIVAGEQDRICPPDLSLRMHEMVAHSRLAILPNVGALTNLEAPIVFNTLLIEFLASFAPSAN
jgi:3-oxoadipate enol-lactonase